MYGSHKADMRKGLTLLVEANSEWQLQLRRLKEQSPPEELDQYSFVLTNATDAVKRHRGRRAPGAARSRMNWPKQKKLTKIYSERPD